MPSEMPIWNPIRWPMWESRLKAALIRLRFQDDLKLAFLRFLAFESMRKQSATNIKKFDSHGFLECGRPFGRFERRSASDFFFGRRLCKVKSRCWDGKATEVDLPSNGKNIIRYTWFHLTFFTSFRCCFSPFLCRSYATRSSSPHKQKFWAVSIAFYGKIRIQFHHIVLSVSFGLTTPRMCNQLCDDSMFEGSLAIKLRGISIWFCSSTNWLDVISSELVNSEAGKRKNSVPCIIN